MGQRAAAEATRIKFGLDTFSHSTVGRSFKSLERAVKLSLEHRFGEEMKPGDHGTPAFVEKAANAGKPRAGKETGMRFPSAGDTASRRAAIAGHLPKLPADAKTDGIEENCRRFVMDRHRKTGRLLL